jgi:hypothetical protein
MDFGEATEEISVALGVATYTAGLADSKDGVVLVTSVKGSATVPINRAAQKDGTDSLAINDIP